MTNLINNLKNNFQPLELSVNNAARSFKASVIGFLIMCLRDFQTEQALPMLKYHDKKLQFKTLHPRWIIDLYVYFKEGKGDDSI